MATKSCNQVCWESFQSRRQWCLGKRCSHGNSIVPEAQANLSGHVGVAVGGMKTTSETEIETEVEVEMLVDAEHVRKAQARVSGDEQFEDGSVNSTVGAVRKPSPMDTFLDWFLL